LFGIPIIEVLRRSPNKIQLFSDFANAGTSQGNMDLGGLSVAAIPSGWFYLEQLNYSKTLQNSLLPVTEPSRRIIRPDEVARVRCDQTSLTSNTPMSLLFHHRFFSARLLPDLNGLFEKTAFGQCAADMAVIACALERYRLAHGQFPQALDPL